MLNKSNTISSILEPTPCAFMWGEAALTRSYFSNTLTCDLSSEVSLEKALAKLAQGESFMLHLKLIMASEQIFEGSFSRHRFLENLSYGNFSLVDKIISFIPKLPESFQDWAVSKKLGPKDFRPFMNDFSASEDFEAFKKMASLNPTKSNGLNIVELYFDLKSTNKIQPDFLNDFKTPENLLSVLKKKRFSNVVSSDEFISDKLSKLNFTKDIKIGLKRIGDQRLLKVEINSNCPDQLILQLDKTSKKIDSIAKAWETKS